MDNIYLQNLIKSAKHLNQKLALNPTEEDIENLLNPLDIDDILINPTGACPIHFSYNYNNIDFTNPRSQGCPRFQSGEELVNSVGKINAYYSL